MKRYLGTSLVLLAIQGGVLGQHTVVIDGVFDDWSDVPVSASDPAGDVHDTDWFGDGFSEPTADRSYSDVDLLEVKFTNDAENLYGYVRATGEIGRTSSTDAGHAKAGRYYFIFTIDVDDELATGYRLAEGGYWPDSTGFDMNMEVEFYDGAFNSGHYINHEYDSQFALIVGRREDLPNRIVRLAPGTYEYYSQWVTFEDCTYVEVEDRGPVVSGIIEVAVSADGHEAEMKAPMWGFLQTPEGERIVDIGQTIVVSASLEASGELSEESIEAGNEPGSRSVWGSDTAEPFRYTILPSESRITMVDCNGNRVPDACDLLTSSSADCNGNDTPDECDIASGSDPDCNGNDTPDSCDIASGTSRDTDLNSVPDDCETFFLRGDVNGDGEVPGTTVDILAYAQHCFLGDTAPPCLAAADADGNGEVCGSVTDIIYLAGYLFLGAPSPPAPFPACGKASEKDLLLGCKTPPVCEEGE